VTDENLLSRLRERKGPSPQGWEGEGVARCARVTLKARWYKIVKSSGSPALDNEALTHLSKAKYRPSTHNGATVSSDHTWQVCFRLDPKPTS